MILKSLIYTLLATIFFLPPFLTLAAFESDLSYGSRGDDVIELQEFLTNQGIYSGPITGNFFSLTLTAVKNFQEREGIIPSAGYFGPKTRAVVNVKLGTIINQAQNQAISETRSTSIVPTRQNSTQQQLAALLEQVRLLRQQITSLQYKNDSESQPLAQHQTQQSVISSQQVSDNLPPSVQGSVVTIRPTVTTPTIPTVILSLSPDSPKKTSAYNDTEAFTIAKFKMKVLGIDIEPIKITFSIKHPPKSSNGFIGAPQTVFLVGNGCFLKVSYSGGLLNNICGTANNYDEGGQTRYQFEIGPTVGGRFPRFLEEGDNYFTVMTVRRGLYTATTTSIFYQVEQFDITEIRTPESVLQANPSNNTRLDPFIAPVDGELIEIVVN
ncbi:MAG: peptidoglycan-binding domain-containing protein [Candidatus Jorgensenbacteria bacterium]|nr:peptidoglycan-binding domain-containing protein [Candidatus Jorgensenbacteria bacterium]